MVFQAPPSVHCSVRRRLRKLFQEVLIGMRQLLKAGNFKITWNFDKILVCVNPLTTNVPHPVETNQLICNANQLTGFYLMGNIGR